MDNTTNNIVQEAETLTTSAIAATSKTPFRTALKITLGIGLGRLIVFLSGLTALSVFILALVKLLS